MNWNHTFSAYGSKSAISPNCASAGNGERHAAGGTAHLRGEHLNDGPSFGRFHTDFMSRVAALPGVESVGVDGELLGDADRAVELLADGVAAPLGRRDFDRVGFARSRQRPKGPLAALRFQMG